MQVTGLVQANNAAAPDVDLRNSIKLDNALVNIIQMHFNNVKTVQTATSAVANYVQPAVTAVSQRAYSVMGVKTIVHDPVPSGPPVIAGQSVVGQSLVGGNVTPTGVNQFIPPASANFAVTNVGHLPPQTQAMAGRASAHSGSPYYSSSSSSYVDNDKLSSFPNIQDARALVYESDSGPQSDMESFGTDNASITPSAAMNRLNSGYPFLNSSNDPSEESD